jgi:hypothetical protein
MDSYSYSQKPAVIGISIYGEYNGYFQNNLGFKITQYAGFYMKHTNRLIGLEGCACGASS